MLAGPYFSAKSASFVDFVQEAAPHLLTRTAAMPAGVHEVAPHATTIVSLRYDRGVLMAGDRRATIGSLIAHREMEKVFPVDDSAMIGIAGTAGIALELVRLFQLEVEHFEKIEGAALSAEGKANRLATLLRLNLPLALQGLMAVPLFAGFNDGRGRIYSYDVTGGRYAERDYYAVGSGGNFARSSCKKLWRRSLTETEAVTVAITALADAAEDDSGTGGPDLLKRIWPIVAVIDDEGYRRVGNDVLAEAAHSAAQVRDDGGDDQ